MELIGILGIGALTFVAAAGQHLYTVRSKGVGFVMTDRAQPLSSDGFAGRSSRALRNTVESAMMYLPAAVLIVVLMGQTALTAIAAGIYLASRVIFLIAHWGALNQLRSVSWAAGMASIVVTYFAALNVILQ